MTAKTTNERQALVKKAATKRQRKSRAGKRKAGYVLTRQYWVFPEYLEKANNYVEKLSRRKRT